MCENEPQPCSVQQLASPAPSKKHPKMASSTTSTPNVFLLAADNKLNLLLPLLRQDHSLASQQDSHGYSLLHAAAAYNLVELARTLVRDFAVAINEIRDEDGETALFHVETVEMARVLVEELGVDVHIQNNDGLTAAEKLEEDGDYLLVAAYLRDYISRGEQASGGSGARHNAGESGMIGGGRAAAASSGAPSSSNNYTPGNPITSAPPPVPREITLNVTTVEQTAGPPAGLGESAGGRAQEAEVVDPIFRRRIEELAARPDFQDEAGQEELRRLVAEAVREHVTIGTGNTEASNATIPSGTDDRTRRRRL